MHISKHPKKVMEIHDLSPDKTNELYMLRKTNKQLTQELTNLQNQFNELVKSCKQIEELNRENSSLKKSLLESNSKIEDFKRRLNICLQNNNEIMNKSADSQLKLDEFYRNELIKLKSQMNEVEISKNSENEQLSQRNKLLSEKLHQSEIEKINSKNLISRIVELSKNYFHLQFNDPQSLCNFLMYPPHSVQSQPKQKPDKIEQLDKAEDEKKNNKKYKEKYHNEKLMRKKLELEVLKMQKANENEILTKQQQDELIQDLIRKQKNEILQIESHYKQEIADLQTKQKIDHKKYRSLYTQTINELIQTPTIKQNEENLEFSNGKNNYSDNQSQSSNNYINDETISDLFQLKTQITNLTEKLQRYEDKIEKLRGKNSQYSNLVEKLQGIIKQLKRKNGKLQNQIIEQSNEIETVTSSTYEQTNQSEITTSYSVQSQEILPSTNEISGLRKTLKVYEDVIDTQSKEIETLTKSRDELISIIQKQNQYLIYSDQFIKELTEMNKINNNKLKNNLSLSSESDEQSGKIDWGIDFLSETAINIIRPIAENDGIPINARIHHVMTVISKYVNNLESSLFEDLKKLEENNDEISRKFDCFVTEIISSLGEENAPSHNEIIERIKSLVNNELNLKQRINELEFFAQESNSSNSFDINDLPQVRKLNQTIKDLKSVNKRRAIEIKECKSVFLEVQRKTEYEKEMLQNANARLRCDLDNIQEQYNEIHKQYDSLLEQIDKIKSVHEEEVSQLQEEIDSTNQLNNIAIEEIKNQAKIDLLEKDKEIDQLKEKVIQSQKMLESFEESSRMTIDDINQSKLKLDKFKRKSSDKIKEMKAIIQQKDDELKEKEQHYNAIINKLKNTKMNEQEHRERMNEAEDKIKKANTMINELEEKVVSLTCQMQQESMKFKADVDKLIRDNKLQEVQQKAKLLSIETNYAVKMDEVKKALFDEKKELFCYTAQQFRPYFDMNVEINDESFKSIIKRVKKELESQIKRDQAIRMLVNAQDNQSTEDALTNMIISMHPQLISKKNSQPCEECIPRTM